MASMAVDIELYSPRSITPSAVFVFVFAVADPPRRPSLFSSQPAGTASQSCAGFGVFCLWFDHISPLLLSPFGPSLGSSAPLAPGVCICSARAGVELRRGSHPLRSVGAVDGF